VLKKEEERSMRFIYTPRSVRRLHVMHTDRRTDPHNHLLQGKNLNRSTDYSNTKTCKVGDLTSMYALGCFGFTLWLQGKGRG